MFSGGFRAKLNSRFRRRASVFATAVVALHRSFLSSTHYSPMHISPSMSIAWRAKNGPFLPVCRQAGRALSFLATRWNTAACTPRTCRNVGSIQDADCIASLPWNIEGKARLYRCARKMSVMRLFSWQIDWLFSSPLIRSRSPSRINKIHTYFCQRDP